MFKKKRMKKGKKIENFLKIIHLFHKRHIGTKLKINEFHIRFYFKPNVRVKNTKKNVSFQFFIILFGCFKALKLIIDCHEFVDPITSHKYFSE